MNEQSPVIITRADIGQFFGYVGGFGLLLGLLGVIWQQGFTFFIFGSLAAGVVGIALWGLIAPQEFSDFITGRQARYSTTAVFSSLLLIGIVVLVYVLLARSAIVADMTEGKRFTLSDTTLQVVESVRRPIRITGFYSPRLLQQRQVDDQFFRLYETASDGQISREYVDPVAQPGIAARFQANDGDVFVSFLGITGEVDPSSALIVTRSSRQERDMTEAISRLLLGGNFVIYFETGLDTLSPEDTSQRGLSSINQIIREYGLITLPLDLPQLAAEGSLIPPDASAIVMARPNRDPGPEVIAILDEYLRRGGALYIAGDTQTEFLRTNSLFNEYLWQNFGLRLLEAVVVDQIASDATELDLYPAITADSAITTNITPENPTRFRIARAIEVDTSPPVTNGWAIQSSPAPASFGETDLIGILRDNTWSYDEGTDLAGPLTTVAWARNTENGASILLVGDSDFMTNGQLATPPGNASLFIDGLLWMTGANEEVSFTPEATVTGQPLIFINTRSLDYIAAFTLLVMPGAMLVLGAGVWFRRSRR